jgi:hypothetical protein
LRTNGSRLDEPDIKNPKGASPQQCTSKDQPLTLESSSLTPRGSSRSDAMEKAYQRG